MARSEAEKPPYELRDHWLATWEQALSTMKDQGTWHPVQRPVLDEYVFALRAADEARRTDDASQWDRHARRARSLARDLVLTPEAQRLHGIKHGDRRDENPFATFVPDVTDLDQKREERRRRRA